MSNPMQPLPERAQQFVEDNTLFLEPDQEIMRDHTLSARTEREENALSQGFESQEMTQLRDRLQSGLDESFDIIEQTGAAPAAKCGDLITGIYTPSGDLTMTSSRGILIFAVTLHYPIKFVNKYFVNEPTVGIKPGDAFVHNDTAYGGSHSPDHSLFMPCFYKDELICWVSATIHEGENGAKEPGGMPGTAESPYDEGLKMSPFRVAENYKLKRDLLTYLQHSTRDPKLMSTDLKVKMNSCIRSIKRIHETIELHGLEQFVAAIRQNLENVEEESRRRIRELPDGVVRVNGFMDSTIRENQVVKISLELRKKGDDLTFDWSGSSPMFLNRPINTNHVGIKASVMQGIAGFVWTDLPKSPAILSPMKFITQKNSMVDSDATVPSCLSIHPSFKMITMTHYAMIKLMFSQTVRYCNVIAPWFNQPAALVYGGYNQYGELIGNLCADLNAMGGGAKCNGDGEHALSPHFGSHLDCGETEETEESVPFMQVNSKTFRVNNHGFGKYRGGSGYETLVAKRGDTMFGFMSAGAGSKFPTTWGLFGGYGCPAYPMSKIKNVNLFEELKNAPEKFVADHAVLMNEQPFEGATYETSHMGMGYEFAQNGEMFLTSQGGGGGYGDVLDRNPELVIKDLEDKLITRELAEDLYAVRLDGDRLLLDAEATEEARKRVREDRIARGKPFDEFVAEWTQDAPPADVPFFGSWNDKNEIYCGNAFYKVPAEHMHAVMVADPKDVKIMKLEAELAMAKSQLAEGGA